MDRVIFAHVGILADTNATLLWYITRATAVSAYVVLVLVVGMGMARPIARQTGESLSWVFDELHQVLAVLLALLVAAHMTTLYHDVYYPFTLTNLLVPVNEPYDPQSSVRIGVIAVYTIILLLSTSFVRRHMPYRVWRGVHSISFLTFVLATYHGLNAGSDHQEPWMLAIYVGSTCGLGLLALFRLVGGRGKARVDKQTATS